MGPYHHSSTPTGQVRRIGRIAEATLMNRLIAAEHVLLLSAGLISPQLMHQPGEYSVGYMRFFTVFR